MRTKGDVPDVQNRKGPPPKNIFAPDPHTFALLEVLEHSPSVHRYGSSPTRVDVGELIVQRYCPIDVSTWRVCRAPDETNMLESHLTIPCVGSSISSNSQWSKNETP